MKKFPPFDAHAHFNPNQSLQELSNSGAVIALTTSMDETKCVIDRHDSNVAWGVGCYPRHFTAQNNYNLEHFYELALRTAVIEEIGLDTVSPVPLQLQIENFRYILDIVQILPRFVSIHSYRATGLVLKELRKRPISVPILHW